MEKIDGADPLENILYISIPEDFNENIGDFVIDPKIMLPIETPENKKDWDISDLSWEMIISAMLKIFAYQPDHEDKNYFRDFVFAVRPTVIIDLTNSATIKAQEKEYDLAEEIFLALIGLDPKNPVLMMNLALLYEQRWSHSKSIENKQLQEKYKISAESAFKEIAGSENPPEQVWYYMGLFYYELGNYHLAEQNFSTYTKLGTDSDRIEEAERLGKEIQMMNLNDELFQEAYSLVHNGEEKKGIEKVKLFLKTNNEVWNAWFLLGWGERRLGNFNESKDAFLNAIKYGKPNSDLYNELSICEMELSNLKSSKEYLNKALLLDPDNMKIISNMGILALKMGNVEEAESFFKIAIEIEPDDPIAKQYISLINNHKY